MSRSGGLVFLALLDGNSFVGFMAVLLHAQLSYLFSLAIDPCQHGRGYGSRAIETRKAAHQIKSHAIDSQMPDETAPNQEQRQKRRSFYLRNGIRETCLFLSCRFVDYEVFCKMTALMQMPSRP